MATDTKAKAGFTPGPYWLHIAESGERQVMGRNGTIMFRYPAEQDLLANAHCAKLQKAHRQSEHRVLGAAQELFAALEYARNLTGPDEVIDAALAKARGEVA